MNASAFPLTGAQAVGAMARGRDKAGARLIFQRCDGKSAGETVILSRARRRLSAIVKQHADRSRPHIVCVYRKGEPWAPTDFSVRARKRWRHTRIGPNDTVAIIYAPRGGGGSGSRGGKAAGIGLLVATIALAAQGDPKRQRDHRVNFGVVTTTPRRMRAEGVSDAAHAIHIATWAASTAYRRRERRTVRMEWAGNPLTRTIPFSVVDGVTYIDEVVIRSGTISRHASTDSGTRSAVISLPVRVGSRVNIIGVYQGGHSGVNGAPSNMHIQRNGGTIKSVPVSFVTYIVNNGASLAYYNCTIAMASYDVGYNGTDTIHVYTDQAFVLDGVLDLNGVSVQAVCFNK